MNISENQSCVSTLCHRWWTLNGESPTARKRAGHAQPWLAKGDRPTEGSSPVNTATVTAAGLR